jgi:hypothetical protein
MAKETMAAVSSLKAKEKTATDDAFWTGPQAEQVKHGGK